MSVSFVKTFPRFTELPIINYVVLIKLWRGILYQSETFDKFSATEERRSGHVKFVKYFPSKPGGYGSIIKPLGSNKSSNIIWLRPK